MYRNDIDDLIEFDNSAFMLRNISRAEIRGAQLGWQYRGDTFSVRTDLVSQQAENAADGRLLLRRPERSMTVNVTKELGEHALGLSVLASSEREDVNGSLPGYVLVNLTGQLRLNQQWQLNGRIENVLDTDYQTSAPYAMQSISGFVELKYRWR